MSQLKPSFIKDIFNKLKDSRFSIQDFDVDLPKTGQILLTVIFKHKNDYKFTVKEEKIVDYVEVGDNYSSLIGQSRKEKQTYTAIVVSESPGDYKLIEKSVASDLGDAISKIPKWCNNIHEDICAKIEHNDNFKNIREQLEELINENIQDENEPFNSEEIAEVKAKLDVLYQKFEDLKEKNIFTEKELKNLKTQIEQAKNNSENYPKGMWARVTNNRILQTISDFAKSKEGREFILDGIKRLFLQ